MKVYNLRTTDIVYRRRTIPANGGCVDFPNLDFVPNRDLKLATDKVLAFGSLPAWWRAEQEMKAKPATKQVTNPTPKPLPQPKKVEVAFKEEAASVEDSAESRLYKRKS